MSSSSRLPLLVVAGLAVAVALIAGRGGRRTPASQTTNTGAVADTTRTVTASGALPSPIDTAAGRVDARTEPLKAEFVYLFDVSTSTHPGTPSDPFERAARMFVPSVVALKQDDGMLPQRYRVGTIGAASLLQEPLCDLRLEAQATFARRDTTVSSGRLKACDLVLRGRPRESATDIRGALDFAALTLHGNRLIVRGIVLATDLDEALQPGQAGATPDLRGICVAVFSMITPDVVAHPDSLTAREHQWNTQLIRWGATRVSVQSILGFNGGDFHAFFKSCPPSPSP